MTDQEMSRTRRAPAIIGQLAGSALVGAVLVPVMLHLSVVLVVAGVGLWMLSVMICVLAMALYLVALLSPGGGRLTGTGGGRVFWVLLVLPGAGVLCWFGGEFDSTIGLGLIRSDLRLWGSIGVAFAVMAALLAARWPVQVGALVLVLVFLVGGVWWSNAAAFTAGVNGGLRQLGLSRAEAYQTSVPGYHQNLFQHFESSGGALPGADARNSVIVLEPVRDRTADGCQLGPLTGFPPSSGPLRCEPDGPGLWYRHSDNLQEYVRLGGDVRVRATAGFGAPKQALRSAVTAARLATDDELAAEFGVSGHPWPWQNRWFRGGWNH